MVIRYFNHLWREMSATGRRTFLPWDLLRGFAEGLLIALFGTFALLVAIQYFHASAAQKSIVAAAFSIGLILSLGYASWSPVLGRKTLRGALPALGVCLGLLGAAAAHSAASYTLAIALSGVCARLSVPVLTGIYRDNYRRVVRGQVYGIIVIVMAITILATNYVGGKMLDWAMENFRSFYRVVAVLALLGGVSVFKMPSKAEPETVTPNPLSCFSAVRENPAFGYVLAAWFLFGFANLALIPQRLEYLSQPEYGFSLGPGTIALIVGVMVEAVRLPMIQIWARLFDRYNFIKLRVALNVLLLGSMLVFFNIHALWAVVVASGLLGAAFAGGAIAWNLWVTKFAPPEETAKYMAVHTFLTGIRGTAAPYLGYLCVEQWGMQASSWVAGGLVTVSILMLWSIRGMATRPDLSPQLAPVEAVGAVQEPPLR